MEYKNQNSKVNHAEFSLYSLIFVVFICKLNLECYAIEMCNSDISLAEIVNFFFSCAHAHTCLLVLDMLQKREPSS